MWYQSIEFRHCLDQVGCRCQSRSDFCELHCDHQWDHRTDAVIMRLEHDETLVCIDSDRDLNSETWATIKIVCLN